MIWTICCSIPCQIHRHNPILRRRSRRGQTCHRQGIAWLLWATWNFRRVLFFVSWVFLFVSWILLLISRVFLLISRVFLLVGWILLLISRVFLFVSRILLLVSWVFLLVSWVFLLVGRILLLVSRVFLVTRNFCCSIFCWCLRVGWLQVIRRNHKAAHAQNHRCAQHRRNCFLPSFSHGFFLLVNSALPRPASPC